MTTQSRRAESIILAVARVMAFPTTALAVIGSVWIFAIMILVNADVFGRALLSRPIDGVPEIVSLSIVGIVFLQMANTLRMGRFISSDMLLSRVQAWRPRLGQALEALYHAFGVVTFAVVTWYVTPKFIEAWVDGTYVGSLGRFTMEIWPILLIIVVGSALTLLQYLAHALHHLLAAANLAAPPAPHPGDHAEFD
ncbi:TRAP transporter small permease subunit [Pseudooceanicola sp. 216_PA32_1]|uniref:TRAP transporter small permease protein n=1 Tax=Pseudooceanicola pacificus TaxID=2676438 RepID=A0A844WD49_9RHOB|nr:TRAP transporter small permease [Pseudooceanicola pacificus]MWB79048.1 TRAP transporter small permease subunit [Pseudooceanicola pacificus]